MRSLARICAVTASLALSACVGTVGGTQQGAPDATPEQGTPDAPPAAAPIDVSGMTMDYFAQLALPTAGYATDGMQPAMTGASGADGAYKLADLPPASSFYVLITGDAANYRPTRNDAVTVTDKSVMVNLYAVSKIDTQRQYSTLGLAPTAGTAVLFVDLRDPAGLSLEGLAPTAITLTDGKGAAITGVMGPYFFGPNGDVVSLATLGTSTKYNGAARAAFLDVPPGSYTLSVAYTPLGGALTTMTSPSITAADAATLVTTGHTAPDGTGQGTGGGANLTFTKDIYPLLQRAALGGQGCANCHNATMLAGGLAYDGPAADVYTKIMAAPGVVVTLTPATSMLLSMPLYETPPDLHPNATWLTNLDPAYVKIMKWITNGAKQ